MVRMRHGARSIRAGIVTATVILALTATPVAGAGGFKTSRPAMLDPVANGVSVDPLISVGETLFGGYRFESIPDGIAWQRGPFGLVHVYVNHETSTVPFPYTPSAPTESNSQNDFTNALLSHLVLAPGSGGILSGRYAIRSSENWQRFCSNYLATAAEGFARPLLFTNEEAVDWVNRSGQAWPATIGSPNARQAGAVVAFDPLTNQRRAIWGMGRHNHENSVAIPGLDEIVILSGDDTFTNNPSQSQLYMYMADDRDEVWNDRGRLFAFVSDDPARQKYEDFAPGDATSITGHFIRVPRAIATGKRADGTDVMSSDFGYPAPPNDGTWQRDPNGIGVDGPQWVLDYWSRTHGVFNFIRLEDIAYDKRPGMGNVVYIADSGRGTAGIAQAGRSTNGRIWRMVLDPEEPDEVLSLSIFVEGDDQPVKTLTEIHQPDNLETTPNGLYATEDPGSSQQFPFNSTDPNATTARVWQVPLTGDVNANKQVVLRVDQGQDEEAGYDVDATTTPGNLGAWESSGIVDASAVFGPGAFLIDVQAHTLWVDKAPGDDNVAPPGPDFTYKREGGQLLLVRIPGG